MINTNQNPNQTIQILAKSEINGKKITLRDHTKNLIDNTEKLINNINQNLGSNKEHFLIKNQDSLKKLLKYACFFHDLGKVSPHFQIEVLKNKSFEEVLKNTNFSNTNSFPKIRHNILSLFFINKQKVKEICNNDEIYYSIFISSVAFHHWRKDEKEYLLHINDNLIKVCDILLEESNNKQNGEILADILKNHFKNFVVDNEKAEDLISFDKDLAKHIKAKGNLVSAGIIPPYSLYFLPERLKTKLQKIDLNLWVYLLGFLIRIDHFSSFCEIENCKTKNHFFDIEKINVQIKIQDTLKQKFGDNFWQNIVNEYNLRDKNIILIAPTGMGKTEFAFLYANDSKFFYTLPLRVATNQIFKRAYCYFNNPNNCNNSNNFNNEEDPFINGNVGLLHSDADLYLIDIFNNSKDTDKEGEILKILEISRHFSLPVIISTGDQIFPTALKYPSYERIYSTLGYSKLIIDEVQAYDPQACAVIVKMIKDIVSLGGKFLLMTATLPDFIKDELQNIEFTEINLYEGKINQNGEKAEETTLLKVKIADITRHIIELIEEDIIDNKEIKRIIEKFNKNKRVLVVLNTIEKAEEVYKKIKEELKQNNTNNKIFLLHSRFTLNQRKQIEENLEKEFKNPKLSNEEEGKILVATQVVEASLDIDADYLFTEIAPIDSLIQRMGRVMRRIDLITGKLKENNQKFKYEDFYNNGENNEKDEPNIYIYYQKDKNKNEKIKESGQGKVYDSQLIQKAFKILKDLENQNKSKIIEIKENEKQKLVCEFYKQKDENKKYEEEKNNKKQKKDNKKQDNKKDSENKENDQNNQNNENISEYLKKFYNTLGILESGYVSENKEEAHKIFREIYTISVIDPMLIIDLNKINSKNDDDSQNDKSQKAQREILEKIVGKINQNVNNIDWIWFKKKIIANYVINERTYKYKEKELEKFYTVLEKYLNGLDDKIKEKLKRYCEGIFFVKSESKDSSNIIQNF
jgi:CRISPR-associated endonuclease/helicase Cas3